MKSCFFNLSALWAFEGCLLIASYISTYAFASQVILMQISLIFLAIPYGMGVVAYDLISDSIDYRDHVEARSMAEYMQKVALVLGGILVLLVSFIRSSLVGIYTKDIHIQEKVESVWVPFMIFMFS
jgi:Na+-driven multidrug efflux pump